VFEPGGYIESVGSYSAMSLVVPLRLVSAFALLWAGSRLLRD
jgi:hypothetical protein